MSSICYSMQETLRNEAVQCRAYETRRTSYTHCIHNG
nr:unnamed protein product [Callosobruchus analis]